MKQDFGLNFESLKAKSSRFAELADPWLREELSRILKADADDGIPWTSAVLVEASDRSDLDFATDYHAVQWRRAAIAFRGRDVKHSMKTDKVSGDKYAIRQQTHRQKGRPNSEYDKVLIYGHADYYATVWCKNTDKPTASMEAGIITDLAALRALWESWSNPQRTRMEHPGFTGDASFIGYDACSLIAHGVVRAAYPDEAYFDRFRYGRWRVNDDQTNLWEDLDGDR